MDVGPTNFASAPEEPHYEQDYSQGCDEGQEYYHYDDSYNYDEYYDDGSGMNDYNQGW